MTRTISDDLLAELSGFVAARTGLHFPAERWRDLARGIQSAASEFDFADAESCARWLLASRLTNEQFEVLASHLTIGETYFFRERQALDALREHILPALIRERAGGEQRLRIWSAGCSTGEEAYSVAVLLAHQFPELNNWQTDIIATDINVRSLRRASAGVYGEWSFRGTPAWVRERYFERREGGRYEIHPRIKCLVNFFYLNLAEDAYPSLLNNTNAMDVIFCRNVLMYFGPEQARRVIANCSRSLVTGGWLIVSPSELSTVLFSEFAPVNFTEAILYRKGGAEPHGEAGTSNPRVDEPAISPPPLPELEAARGADNLPRPQPEAPVSPEAPEDQQTPPADYSEAMAYYEQGRYGEAIELLLGLVFREPENSQAVILLSRSCANLGDLAEAARWCERAVAADKMNPRVHFLRATILQEQHQTAEAIRSFRRALYLDQNFALAHFALGNLARGQGKRKESEKHFVNALALLGAHGLEDVLPESEGLTAGRLAEIIRQAMSTEAAA
jgi:chemotaxis protein methyltransferase CheR